MKDSKDKESRISNLKNMFDYMNDEEPEEESEIQQEDEYDDIEEDEELINYLNENNDEYEIDDEYIYRPGKDDGQEAMNLEEDAEIDENFIIETNINEQLDENSQVVNEPGGLEGDNINESFDNLVNTKIGEKPILAIISLILGIVFIVASVIVYNADTERIIDNVISGENEFVMVILIIIGILLIIYGIFKIFNLKSPFDNMINSINEVEEEKESLKKADDEKEEKVLPKSNIPLDKESYKVGEFDVNDLKKSLKNSFSKTTKSSKEPSPDDEEEVNVEDLPPAREKSDDEKGLIKEEIEQRDYEQAKLDGESIDDIFADVDDLKEDEK